MLPTKGNNGKSMLIDFNAVSFRCMMILTNMKNNYDFIGVLKVCLYMMLLNMLLKTVDVKMNSREVIK